MSLRLFQVDAFSSEPFAGNPAAVCLLEGARDDAWMQSVAREMNLSETAFLEQRPDGYGLRWFTPAVEVDLCGHATLASAHVLWEQALVAAQETISFHTRSGVLRARRIDGWIELDFPATPPEPSGCNIDLEEALGAAPIHIGRSERDLLVVLEDEETVRNLAPRMPQLAQAEAGGIIVTSAATTDRYDFVSRFFAPRYGIDEDPVTGSAHCCLGPYWGERLGKQEMFAYQASARGGEVKVVLAGDRVLLGGRAVTIFEGRLL